MKRTHGIVFLDHYYEVVVDEDDGCVCLVLEHERGQLTRPMERTFNDLHPELRERIRSLLYGPNHSS